MADLALKGDADGALEKAKDAGKRERALCKHREANGLVDQINIDLTYAVCFQPSARVPWREDARRGLAYLFFIG